MADTAICFWQGSLSIRENFMDSPHTNLAGNLSTFLIDGNSGTLLPTMLQSCEGKNKKFHNAATPVVFGCINANNTTCIIQALHAASHHWYICATTPHLPKDASSLERKVVTSFRSSVPRYRVGISVSDLEFATLFASPSVIPVGSYIRHPLFRGFEKLQSKASLFI